MCNRVVIIAIDTNSCTEALKNHKATGSNHIMINMQAETFPYNLLMWSIELFLKHMVPKFKEHGVVNTEAIT